MIHHGQGLALCLEPRDHLLAVHAGFDDLERNFAAYRMLLLGHVDDAHAAFTNLLEQLVRSDFRAGSFRKVVMADGNRGRFDRLSQEATGFFV